MAKKIPDTKEFYEEWIEPRIQLVLTLVFQTLNETNLTDEQRSAFISKLNEKIVLNEFLKG